MPTPRLYTDAADLFETEETLDFVEICTRPDSHRELVELAARYRVDILCQKPAAAVRPALKAMIEACISTDTRLMIHENWRFRPWYRAIRAEIDAGSIGRPIRLRISHRDTRALRADGFADQPYLRTTPRLILLEMGCHLIDTARYLIGEIQTVSATMGKFGRHNLGEDVATLSIYFAGGCLGLLDMSWCAPADCARAEWALNETVAEGTEGTIRVLPDGSLEWISPSGHREQQAGEPASRRPGLCERICRDPAPLHRGPDHRHRARNPGKQRPENHGRRLGRLPLGRGRTHAGCMKHGSSDRIKSCEPFREELIAETCHMPAGSIRYGHSRDRSSTRSSIG